ncbi:MAG: T9SS C-terminal target domain-containing protein [Sphingobacteriia bacterium]|nr:T9SS C-terminal target domain-containing protein [Sphingobacteriia bacterium]
MRIVSLFLLTLFILSFSSLQAQQGVEDRLPVSLTGMGFDVQVASASLISIAPPMGNQGQTLSVVVTGTSTNFLQASSTFYLMQSGYPILPSSTTVLNNNDIYGMIWISNTAPTGWYDVIATVGSSTLLLPTAFLVNPMGSASPTIVQINPNYVTRGTNGFQIAVQGSSTHFSSAASSTISSLVNNTVSPPSSITQIARNIGTDLNFSETYNIPANALAGWYDYVYYNATDGILNYLNAVYVDWATLLDFEGKKENLWLIYPNPSEGMAYLSIPDTYQNETHFVSIVDMKGSVIRSWEQKPVLGKILFSVSDLQTGMYWISVTCGDQKTTLRLSVK